VEKVARQVGAYRHVELIGGSMSRSLDPNEVANLVNYGQVKGQLSQIANQTAQITS